ncbi:MAG: RNA pseudouridine synthase [Paludibacteraceae bacterium]|nr:RNA pseudouridine synthase [Paludibacteraceae bacterium]
MQEKTYPSRKPAAKHQPKGLQILYEDKEILVVNKNAGLLTMGTDREKQRTAHFILNEYVKRGVVRSRNRVFIVHRLDRDTSGLLVFAKNEEAKHYLQDNWKDFSKQYIAVVHGVLEEKEGVITSYLMENKALRVYSVQDAEEGKLAKTGYKVIKESENFSFLEIHLFTGRKNQIRVHLSELGHPIVGDKIYGTVKGYKSLALHSSSLTIKHPITHREMNFATEIPHYFKALLKKQPQKSV